jgi:CheY-like chemotaxis protein
MMPDMDGFDVAERIRRNGDLHQAPLIMVSSAASHDDVDRCQKVGIARYLTKPIVQSELLNAVLTALAPSRERAEPAAPAVSQTVGGPKLRILLAEDGVINQRVAVGFLQGRGHHVTIANNGREAVEAAERQDFDVILMDVQMPEMDGLEATAEIRRRDRERQCHTTIVAMTAAAMKGDRDRFLAAGMDSYISKPIDAEKLFQMLDELPLPPAGDDNHPPASVATATPGGDPPNDPPPIDPEVFDLEKAAQRVPGGKSAVCDMVPLLFQEGLALLQGVRDGAAARDAERLQREAHTLKSTANIFCAQRVSDVALRLEMMGRGAQFDDVATAIGELEQELSRLFEAIRRTFDLPN